MRNDRRRREAHHQRLSRNNHAHPQSHVGAAECKAEKKGSVRVDLKVQKKKIAQHGSQIRPALLPLQVVKPKGTTVASVNVSLLRSRRSVPPALPIRRASIAAA